MLQEYQLVQATNNEAEKIVALIKDAAQWIHEKGINQWRALLGEEEDQELMDTITSQETYVVKKENQLVATFILFHTQNQWDQQLWEDSQDEAVYVHKLAVHPAFTGMGIGRDILHWVTFYVQEKGKKMVRLDCVGHNKKLNDFYLRCGFTYVGEKNGQSLFEYVVDSN